MEKHFHFEKLVRFWKAIQIIKDDTVSNRGSKIRNGKHHVVYRSRDRYSLMCYPL